MGWERSWGERGVGVREELGWVGEELGGVGKELEDAPATEGRQ